MTIFPAALLMQGVPPLPGVPGVPGIPFEAVIVAKSFFTMVAVIALGIPLIRALSRRFLAPPAAAPLLSGDIITRLERIEQAVDAMSIEVERISENQRFATKLLTEARPQSPGALPGGGTSSR